MIQPLRNVHRRVFMALAVILPTVVLAGFAARHPALRSGAHAAQVPSSRLLLRSWILRDVRQLSIAETAQVLGISEANVKTRLSLARLQMRDALAPGFDAGWNNGRKFEATRAFE
jgi:hypothetical protein